jgi:hypothetical protein
MAIFDQIELFSNADFSGSYTDRVFRGPDPIMSTSNGGLEFGREMRKEWFVVSPPKQAFFAESAFSKAGNITGSFIPKNEQDDKNLLFLEQRAYLTKGKRAGKNNLFINFFSNDETFFDSILTSPLENQILNGGNFSIVNGQGDEENSWSALYDEAKNRIDLFPNNRLAVMFVGTSLLRSVNDSSEFLSEKHLTEMSDDIWDSSFPFERRYISLPRYKTPSFSVEQIGTSGLRALFAYDGSGSGVGGAKDLLFNSVYGYSGVSDNYDRTFERIVCISFIRVSALRVGTLGSIRYNFDSRGKLISYNNFFDDNKSQDKPAQPQPASVEENFRLYFGFSTAKTTITRTFDSGAPNQRLILERNHFHLLNTISTQNFGSGAISQTFGISGYKYGVIRHFPLSSKLIFRRGRYGQFRDLLEQRLYTKYYNNNREEPLEAAVVAQFVANSRAENLFRNGYFSTEPGFYNKEYQSVKPFADDATPIFIEEENTNEVVIV